MRLKSIQDTPSIAKSLIGALVTVLVMSMVMARAMEPQDEDRFLRRIKPHLSTNITSDYTNKTRERRLTNLLNDEIIATFALKLGTDLLQGEEEIPALQKYERYFEVIRNFPSFLKENDLKESSSKEVLEILLRHVDRDTALVSDLGLLDKKKADELMSLLLSEWKKHGVTPEDALKRLMLGKSVDEFLDSELINVWEKFGKLLTGVSGAPALRRMLPVLSNKIGFVGLAEALVVRHTASENSMSGRLYRQQLLVWNENKELSQESVFGYFGEDLGLSVWMDFVLLRAPFDHDPSSYRIEVLEWLNKKEISIKQLDEKMLDIRDLMNDQLIIKKLMIKLVMKKEVMIKRLTNKKLMMEELKYKESTNTQLMAMNFELMNDESISKSLLNKEDVLIKELMKRKSMIEDLVKKESMIKDLMKKESMIEDSMKEELEKMELITKNLIREKSWINDRDIEKMTEQRNEQNAVIKGWIKKYDTNEELMNKELMDKESMKEELMKMELMIKELIEEKLKNDALMIEEVTEDRKKQDAIVEKLMNKGFTSDELTNKELKSMQELMIEKLEKNHLMMRELMVKESTKKELMDKKLVNEGLTSTEMRNNELLKEELRNKEKMKNKLTNLILTRNEMLKWRDLLRGDSWGDRRLESRRRKLIHG